MNYTKKLDPLISLPAAYPHQRYTLSVHVIPIRPPRFQNPVSPVCDHAPCRPHPVTPPVSAPVTGLGLRSQARPAAGGREVNRAAWYGARPFLEPGHLDEERERADAGVSGAAHPAAGAAGGSAPAAGDDRRGREQPTLRRVTCFFFFVFFRFFFCFVCGARIARNETLATTSVR